MYLYPGLKSIYRRTDNFRNVDPSNTTEGSNRYIRDERNLLAHFKQDLQYMSEFGYIQYNSGGIPQGTVIVIPRTFKDSNYHEPQTIQLRGGGTSNYLVTLLLYVRTICQEIRKNEKKRRLIPFQNELKL